MIPSLLLSKQDQVRMYDNTESPNKENLDRSAPKTSGSPLQNSASPDQQENSVPANMGRVDEEPSVPENVEDRGAEFESFYVNPEFACGIPIGEIGAALLAWKTKLETIQLKRVGGSHGNEEDTASTADTEATTIRGSVNSEDGHECEFLSGASATSYAPDSTNTADAIARIKVDDVSLPLRKRPKVTQSQS
ncbi:hypothetical protein CNMCM5878_004992 [Aspergillus fumigatiaffinis]|nr:hypothetical protein CNMCM5878_004992 [Aspergillus fumigatiaffinis]